MNGQIFWNVLTRRLFSKQNKSKMSSWRLPTKRSFKLQDILQTAGAHRCQHFTASFRQQIAFWRCMHEVNQPTRRSSPFTQTLTTHTFFGGMEDEKLTKFLRFCTSSYMVCVAQITSVSTTQKARKGDQSHIHPQQCRISLPHIHPFRCSGRNGTAHCPQSIGSLTLFELSLKSAYENCLIAVYLGILGSPKSG